MIQSRLAQMRLLPDDLERIGSPTAQELAGDRFLRHVVEHVLVQLVQLAVAVNGACVSSTARWLLARDDPGG